jgi:hypothetical protein
LAATTFSSCEKVIDFDGEETEPIMVMISFPDSGSPWKVRLTESRFFLSNDTIATIKNADVTTEVNGRPTNSLVTITGKDLKSAEVINALGQRVASVTGESERLQIDLSSLPAGIYFINITDTEGRKCVRKVVKE